METIRSFKTRNSNHSNFDFSKKTFIADYSTKQPIQRQLLKRLIMCFLRCIDYT